MLSQYLWQIGSVVFIIQGLLHFHGTFFSDALRPKNPTMKEAMKNEPLKLSDTFPIRIWNPWIGFNAAFSNGVLFLGLAYFYLGFEHFAVIQEGHFLPLIAIVAAGLYVWISQKYLLTIVWIIFAVPLVCFIGTYLLILSQ